METSLCSYSFHRRLEAGQHDVFQYIRDCQALGCTQLDLWNGHLPALLDADGQLGPSTAGRPADPAELLPDEMAYLDRVRAAAEAAALPMGCLAVDGAHIYEAEAAARALQRQRALRWLSIAARLGARQVRIDTGGTPELPPEQFAIIVAGYQDLIGEAGPHGLEIVIENHWGASRPAANVLQFLEAVPELGLLFDSGNWPAGQHEAAWAQCARFAVATHIKTRAVDAQGHEPNWDLPKAVGHLLASGYDGCWGIESVPREGDEFEHARRSLALIRRLVSPAGATPSTEAA